MKFISGVRKRVGFQKGGFGGCALDPKNRNDGAKNGTTAPKTGTRVQKTERRYQNRNKGTFAKTTLLQNRLLVFFWSSRSAGEILLSNNRGP